MRIVNTHIVNGSATFPWPTHSLGAAPNTFISKEAATWISLLWNPQRITSRPRSSWPWFWG